MIINLINRVSFLVVFCLCVAFNGNAQTYFSVKHDFDFAYDSIGWQKSNNWAYLNNVSTDYAGIAKIILEKENGKLKNYYESENAFKFSVYNETFKRLNSKSVLYGYAGYENRVEKNQNGSSFLNPEEMAFDIVNTDYENVGSTKLEVYTIKGGLGYDINNKFSLGAFLDYKAKSYVKTKDLRHTNKILDMNLSLGGSYKLNKYLTIGLNYNYSRYIEGIVFNTYGTTDKLYYSLINYGVFYGKNELFDQYGFTAKGENNPYVNNKNGVAFQLDFKVNSSLYLFNEISFNKFDGYFGKQSSSSILHTNHNGKDFKERFFAYLKSTKYDHKVELEIRKFEINNFENSYRSETNSSGNTIYEYYARNEVGNKSKLLISGDYILERKRINGLYDWAFEINSSFTKRKVSSIIYPYYREQNLSLYTFNLAYTKHIHLKRSIFSLKADLGFKDGFGEKYNDKLFSTPSSSSGKPISVDSFLLEEYYYLTSPTLSPIFKIRWGVPIKNLNCFLSASYQYNKTIKNNFFNAQSHFVSISTGVTF
ncbi:MAG: hypothetical protein Q4F97_06785 [Bacteroidales bacterium]|nr:hypothetical protein [Bacteroidales bacterium]